MKNKQLILMLIFMLFVPFTGSAADTPTERPQAFLPESVYEFAPVLEGTRIEHDFIIHNRGNAPLSIIKIESG